MVLPIETNPQLHSQIVGVSNGPRRQQKLPEGGQSTWPTVRSPVVRLNRYKVAEYGLYTSQFCGHFHREHEKLAVEVWG